MTKITFADRVLRGKESGGVRWGDEIFVIARHSKKELWRTPGCTWRGEYFPGQLLLVRDGEKFWKGHGHDLSVELQEGGRLSRKVLDAHAQAINDFFGRPMASLLSTRYTLIIEDE